MYAMTSWLPPPPAFPNADPARKRSKNRLVLLLVLLAFVVVVVLWSCSRSMYHDYRLTSVAVERFHRQLNNQDYDGIYEEASDEFRNAGTHADEVKVLDTIHQKMGNAGNVSSAGFHVNWRNGHVFVDEVFKTQFVLGEAQESFVWIVQDQPRLVGYHVDSANLR